MLVISDTSPLSYSILIGVDHILPKLFGEIVIPAAVMSEYNILMRRNKFKHGHAPHPIG